MPARLLPGGPFLSAATHPSPGRLFCCAAAPAPDTRPSSPLAHRRRHFPCVFCTYQDRSFAFQESYGRRHLPDGSFIMHRARTGRLTTGSPRCAFRKTPSHCMAVAGLSQPFSTRIESIFRFLSVTRSFTIFFRLSPLHRPFVSALTGTGRPRSAGRASAASARASHASGILFLLSADHAVLRDLLSAFPAAPAVRFCAHRNRPPKICGPRFGGFGARIPRVGDPFPAFCRSCGPSRSSFGFPRCTGRSFLCSPEQAAQDLRAALRRLRRT